MLEYKLELKRQVDESHPIVVGQGLLENVPELVRRDAPAHRYAIITDSNVRPLYGENLAEAMNSSGLKTDLFDFQAGEKSKTEEVADNLLERLCENGHALDSIVIALGGGVVGDVAGYVAGRFCRGIRFIQIPTTTVSAFDSSLGGKTGVDFGKYKNKVGLFVQPKAIYVDVSTFSTLTDEVYREGFAEAIKHGIIRDKQFFEFLETNAERILARDPAIMQPLVHTNLGIKGDVVREDIHETKGLRQILNYGHTAGHAIESLLVLKLGQEAWHGQCVSRGIAVVSEIESALGYSSIEEISRKLRLLERFGLPLSVPIELDAEDIIQKAKGDKKVREGKTRYVLARGIGRVEMNGQEFTHVVDDEVVGAAIQSHQI